jgi:hypothetical protein
MSYFAFSPFIVYNRWKGISTSFKPQTIESLNSEMARLKDFSLGEVEIAEKALNNIWSIPFFGERPIHGDATIHLDKLWGGKVVNNLSWELSLHSLYILRNLVFAHKDTGDNRFLDKGREIIESWAENNPRNRPPSRFSWGDHSTANRALIISAFLDYCNAVGFADQKINDLGAALLLEHGLFLIHPKNYSYSHNHGIYQDYALIVIATHLKEVVIQQEWVNIATSRLEKLIKTTYSKKGIHLENSPGYHQSITELLENIAGYMHAVGLKPPIILVKTLELAKAAMPIFIMPDRTIVPVGDTFRDDIARTSLSTMTDSFIVDPETGYGLIAKAFHIFFMASNNSFTHKHCDDLSVIVSGPEGTIIGDVGFLNYQDDDFKRNFTLSWPAHNTITIDSQPQLEPSLRCGIDAYGSTANYILIRGTSMRKAGQIHIRSIFYDKQNEALVIIDKCKSAVSEKWLRHFQFEPNIVLDIRENNIVDIAAPWKKSYNLIVWPRDPQLESIVGKLKPLQGWIAQPFGNLIPAPVTVESQIGTDVTFIAALSANNSKGSLELVSDNVVAFKGPNFHRTISIFDSFVEVVSKESKGRSTKDYFEVEKIPLKLMQLRDPFDAERKPIHFRKRMAVLGMNGLAWLVLIFILWVSKAKTSRWGLALIIICTSINVVAMIKFFPRLSWW